MSNENDKQVNSTPTPKPTPKPTPGPRPNPGMFAKRAAASRPTPAAPATPSSKNDPAKWGRVDEDGNVYVTVDGTERQIGSWQAGSPAEGLQHYGARFDDLDTEVSYLESRLETHPDDANHIKEKAQELFDGLSEAKVIGDIKALGARLEQILGNVEVASERAKAAKEELRERAIAAKEALAAEAEALAADSTDWKQAGDRIRDILEEWKSIKGIDRSTDDALWKRYSRARDSFNRRRGAHFAELDRGRATARRIKEELIEQAESIKDSTDWNETAKKFRELMDKWKQAGRAQRDIDDKLWAMFRAAQDTFFNARNAANNERDQEFQANADAKLALLDEYEPLIDPEKGLEGARQKLRELQDKWEEIGFVPRNQVREFEEKIAAIEQRVSDAEEAQWRRTDPEAHARAQQFLDKVADFQAQADAAEQKGNAKKAAELRAQAEQWQQWADAAIQAVENR